MKKKKKKRVGIAGFKQVRGSQHTHTQFTQVRRCLVLNRHVTTFTEGRKSASLVDPFAAVRIRYTSSNFDYIIHCWMGNERLLVLLLWI